MGYAVDIEIVGNNIRALEMIVEDLRNDLNDAICEYEEALADTTGFYNVELARQQMEDCQRYYDEALNDFEREKAWFAEFSC